MSETTCQCGKPTGSTATLCKNCRKTLEIAIVNINSYYADLDTLKTRQVRFGDGGPSNEAPLGMDARFAKLGAGSEVEYAAKNTVVAWVRIIEEYMTPILGPACGPFCLHVSCSHVRKTRPPVDSMASMCRYLLTHSDWLRISPMGGEALDELCDVEGRLCRLIDRPIDRWYAGPCNANVTSDDDDPIECGEALYALEDFGEVECRKCGAQYDVKARRDWLLKAAEDRDATTTTIARAITTLSDDHRDEGKLAARIRQWASRNQIFVMRHEYVGGILRPMYRIGDVLDLISEDLRRAEEKRQRKQLRRGA